MAKPKLILDYVYDHEAKLAERVYLTQPVGGDKVIDYTWKQTLDQSRRMAAHIKAQGLEPGARVAILSKNCAHFFMAELAIWMAGCTTVAIFPTETAETISYVLEHSGASLLFVGKLDTRAAQKPGIPASLPCIAFPLAPKNSYEGWDAVVARPRAHPRSAYRPRWISCPGYPRRKPDYRSGVPCPSPWSGNWFARDRRQAARS